MGFFMEEIYKIFLACSGVSTDTRSIEKGNLFICLKGQNYNGNQFVSEALEKGANYVLIDEEEYHIEGKTFITDNCLVTLQQLANYHRTKFNIPIIGITGSNGKTTTKELTAHLLSQTYNILYTAGNLNNHIGVPLTLLKLKQEHQMAIIEMGANHPGDIQELCDIAKPNYGIISNIGKAHLLGFKNIEGVIETKTALYKSVNKNHGTLFVNKDDAILINNLPNNVKTLFYSGKNDQNADIVGNLDKLTPFIHLSWKSSSYSSPTIETQIIGEYNFYNLLAAITVAAYFKVDEKSINTGIETYKNENNRSQLQSTENNELIMDAYNANPSSMKSAITSFAKVERENKMMILGDMFELGEESYKEHEQICSLANSTRIPTYFIGENFYKHQGSSDYFFSTKEAFITHLKAHKTINHFILLKGSRGIALESLIDYL